MGRDEGHESRDEQGDRPPVGRQGDQSPAAEKQRCGADGGCDARPQGVELEDDDGQTDDQEEEGRLGCNRQPEEARDQVGIAERRSLGGDPVTELPQGGHCDRSRIRLEGGAIESLQILADGGLQVEAGLLGRNDLRRSPFVLTEDGRLVVALDRLGGDRGLAPKMWEIGGGPEIDLVLTCENAKGDLSGVWWCEPGPDPAWHDISGAAGVKFDRIELLDLDADGDLDVITCEERDNLGVFWYENPNLLTR